MTHRSSFAPFQLVEVEPDGSFRTTLAEVGFDDLSDAEIEAAIADELVPSGRRHEVRPGDGYLRRDGSIGPTFEVWAVEDGQEWCVDADIRGLRSARRCAAAWQHGYREALSG